mmetsp:Transcript_10320/g.31927  ORF Transcript_10320/g.31927 Transcript_10320/m.31927 type:complete len:141 (+) Transcript_10320:321-743(+)
MRPPSILRHCAARCGRLASGWRCHRRGIPVSQTHASWNARRPVLLCRSLTSRHVAVVSSPDALGTMSTVVVDRKRAAIREWLTTSASFHGDAGSWPSPVPEAVPKLPSAAGHHQRALFGVLDAEFGGLVSGGESPRSLFE